MPDDTRTQEIEKRIDPDISRAIALSGGSSGNALSIAPQNMGEMLEFSKLMAVSGPCVRPAFRGKPGACLAIALQAFRTGADPFAVANKAYITTNRAGEEQIAYEAQYINSVLNTSRQLSKRLRASYKGHGDSRQCTITGYIVGEDEPFDYESPTIAAIAVKNSPLWKGDPDQQLYYYSSRAWARRYLPEVLLGMYTPDEIHGEIIDMEPPPPPRREEFDQPRSPTDQELARDDPNLCPHGWSKLHPQPCPDCEAKPASPELSFEVTDLEGEVETHHFIASAEAKLLDLIAEAAKRSCEAVEGAWESNLETILTLEGAAGPLHDAYREAIEAWKAKSEPARSGGAGSPPTPTVDAFGLPPLPDQPAVRPAPPQSTMRWVEPTSTSLTVPLRPGPRPGTTDWAATASDMIERIDKITNPSDAQPNGAFELANRQTLELMRNTAKQHWGRVKYELSTRERELREQATP